VKISFSRKVQYCVVQQCNTMQFKHKRKRSGVCICIPIIQINTNNYIIDQRSWREKRLKNDNIGTGRVIILMLLLL